LIAFFIIAIAASAAPRAAVPSLTVAGDDGSSALALESLRVDILIRGHLARTTYELTYRSNLPNNSDGDFAFPLPIGGEVSDLGLYFNGRLRHAVAVERVQGRAVYETAVHRRVDPALAEWSASSRAFHFRVFPIPPHGTKVVHIAIDQELTSSPYELDLRWEKKLREFELNVDSDASVQWSDGRKTRLHERDSDFTLNGVLRASRDNSETALVAYYPDDRTWYASAPVRVHSTARAIDEAPHVTLLYDVSASAVQRDHAKLRAFLAAFLAKQAQGARISVIPFHIAVESARDTDALGLDNMLTSIPAAGATNLVDMLEKLPSIVASSPAGSRIVIVTDGINTMGDSQRLSRAVASAGKLRRPLTLVNASSSADDNFLGNLARTTGGTYVDVTQLEANEAADSAMRLATKMTIGTRLPLRDMLPSTVLATNDVSVTVSARSTDRINTFPVITSNARHEVPLRELESTEEADLVRRAWARARLRSLLDNGGSPDDVLEHGRTFSQLTPRTSLIVLETWQDYEVNGFPLPPDLRAERDAELAQQRKNMQFQQQRPQSIQMRGRTNEQPPNGPVAWYIRGTTMYENSPLPGTTVTLDSDDHAMHIVTVTDANGRFWLVSQRAPSSDFVVRAELSGLNTITRRFSKTTPKGGIVEIVMRVASVQEAITVTAAAPLIDVNATAIQREIVPTSLRQRDAVIADHLLQSLSSNAPPPEDDELAEKSVVQRLDLVDQVIAKLKSLPSIDERFRYYVASRAILGGEKLFQANAALAIRDEAPDLAVRWLTDLAEANPDDAPTLRILGRVLDGWGRGDLARLMFERALEMSPRETQTWREAMLLAAKEHRQRDFDDLQRRYAAADRDQRMSQTDDAIDLDLKRGNSGGDPRRDQNAELQIESMWDSNYTDVDLHVIEPDGEEVYYRHMNSKHSGWLHADVTTGFGPETYTIPHLMPGPYKILLHYYAGDNTRTSMETLVHVIVYVRGERQDVFTVLTNRDENRVVAVINP
jgi:hypothetical protein